MTCSASYRCAKMNPKYPRHEPLSCTGDNHLEPAVEIREWITVSPPPYSRLTQLQAGLDFQS